MPLSLELMGFERRFDDMPLPGSERAWDSGSGVGEPWGSGGLFLRLCRCSGLTPPDFTLLPVARHFPFFWNITFTRSVFFVASRKAGEPFDWLGPVLLSTPVVSC
jgi:hypothetical protein